MRSARLAAKMAASPSPSTSTTTPSTNVTPAFSSISAADTPVTSDNEDDEILVPKKGKRQPNTLTRAAAKGKRKSRPETSDSEQDNGEEASASGKSATKRRATENRAYVEIIQKLKKGPAGKVCTIFSFVAAYLKRVFSSQLHDHSNANPQSLQQRRLQRRLMMRSWPPAQTGWNTTPYSMTTAVVPSSKSRPAKKRNKRIQEMTK